MAVRVTQVVVETVQAPDPLPRVSQVVVEAVHTSSLPVVTQVVLEAIHKAGDDNQTSVQVVWVGG